MIVADKPSKCQVEFGGRERSIKLETFFDIVSTSVPKDSEAQFVRAGLQRDVSRLLTSLDPGRHRALRVSYHSYWLGLLGHEWRHYALSDVLVTATRALHDLDPGATEALSHRTKYFRRYVSRDKTELYGGRAYLGVYAREFAPGWYVDTNLSFVGTANFLHDIFSAVGLEYRKDWFFGRFG